MDVIEISDDDFILPSIELHAVTSDDDDDSVFNDSEFERYIAYPICLSLSTM